MQGNYKMTVYLKYVNSPEMRLLPTSRQDMHSLWVRNTLLMWKYNHLT